MAKVYPNRLRFDFSAEEIKTKTAEAIASSKKTLDDIAAIPTEQRTFENTIRALALEESELATLSSSLYFPSYVSSSKDVRDAANEATQALEAYDVEKDTREDLYQAVLGFKQRNPEQAAALQGEDKRFLDKVLLDFERNGLALVGDKKQRVKEIKQRISELCIKFNQNLTEDVTKVALTKEELAGVPEDFFENLPKTDDGGYYVSLKYPELFPVLERCSVEATRKKMEFANSTKCMTVNTPILEEVVKLRDEEAKLLGYENHAAYILAIRMAKTTDTVRAFLKDLTAKLEKPALRDVARLKELKKKEAERLGVPFDNKLNIWDWRYYDTILLEAEYQVNHELIKEYFPLERALGGMLDVYQEVLGLVFKQMPTEQIHVWHPDVTMFEVFDAESNEFLGHFYLDLHPRDGKYGHAAKFDLQKSFLLPDGSRQLQAAAIVANFTKPTPTRPSLLKFNEVETLFHEFGHAMHELCARTKYLRFGGTRVERDFVEAPSQMLENWCYDSAVLKRLSGHYQDASKSLPEELRQKLLAAKLVNEALKNRRQLHFGTFDMLVHTAPDGVVNSAELWQQCMKDIALTESQPGTNGAATFGHIMGGYSAGYYGYLWSKVYSSDMFVRFKNEGVLNKTLGKRYREKILLPGGSRDAMDMITDFLERAPNQDAFLEEIGAAEQ
eukprot:TRINITY_DN5937_c0_g1_i1.p1 TRINITY_DN5937_c0_g1~~TRINITY_DN5937_c0_g1_i1.p1  ORF type:complete len:776 (+),score=281.64 TRINITY_DN5937_c0_g1_i1:314-2329(+)